MINPSGLTEIGLDVFGGNQLDMQATDLPAGLSPDCSDVAFLHGSVFTRPSLRRFSTLGTTSQILYASTFLRPDGTVVQMEFTADGKMWADGVLIGQTKAGNRFFGCNAFGKYYIATSDGSHGADVPLQYTPEGYLDRVSQDGPGDTATLANYALQPGALVTGSAGTAVAVTSITPINPVTVQTGGGGDDGGGGYNPPTYETYYSTFLVTTSTAHGLGAGESISISGNTLYSFTGYVSQVDSTTTFEVPNQQPGNATGTGGTVTPSAPFLQRSGNEVTATVAAPMSLQVGYQVTLSGVADQTIGTVSSIVINNTAYPGQALVTTTAPTGLIPGENVTLTGVSNVAVGGGINTLVTLGNITTVTTNTAHNLQVGATVLIQTASGPFLPFTVSSVSSPTAFSYSETHADATRTGGSVTLIWPGNQNTSQLFTVQSVSSSTSFFIALTYSNGTWTSGTLTYPWNGTFYVTSVLSPTSFTYRQVGPDEVLTSGTGLITPTGQIASGQRSCVVIFLTRTGFLTQPSIPCTVTANGSQYLFVSNIPIGPSNVVARWLALTGANGGKYFVLPIPPRDPSGSFAVGTSSVILDNTTTSAIIDFADQSLLAGFAIDIPGNNLFRQEVLGPCLGFYSYASRLIPWGERNKIQQFRNMGFEGGYYATSPNFPLGWTVTGSDGSLTGGDYGQAWRATSATISQTAYQDKNGIAIIQPNTQYTFRAWSSGAGSVVATISSASTGFSTTATIAVTGGFSDALFLAKTPITIPSDLVLSIGIAGGTATIDELEIVYTENPYRLAARASYVNNPEAFDGVTGILGPANDPHAVMGMEDRKDVLSILTNGPQGSLYETENTPSGEPSTWSVRHLASKCGLVSVWGITKFEDWFQWISDTGLRIFDGGSVEKMSQEIQPWWNTMNPSAKQFSFLANDPYTRRCYLGAATGTSTVVNEMYVLDYRDLNTEAMLANAGTLRISGTGKVVTTDLTRKWTPWTMTINFCGLLTLPSGEAGMVFCGGTGVALSDAAYSALYALDEGVISGYDDDFGNFWQHSTYPSYFFISVEEAQQRQLGAHRLSHQFMSMNCTGVGTVYVQAALDRLDNIKFTSRALTVSEDLARDLEIGLNVSAERISYRVCCQPTGPQPFGPNTTAGFRLSSLTVGMKTDVYAPVRGRNS